MRIDYDYLCRITANLSGIPVRVYLGDRQISFHSPVTLIADPVLLYRKKLWDIQETVGYYLTEGFSYYGVIRSDKIRMIIGPTWQLPVSDQELKELAFRIGLNKDDTEEFCQSIKAIVNMPVESLLLMLCSINYMINGEKLELRDLMISGLEQDAFRKSSASQVMSADSAPQLSIALQPSVAPHNSYSQEQTILQMIRTGDTTALHHWLEQAPAVRSGILAPEHLRQIKNIFIVTATLASRAAIRGGLDVEDAFSLSDSYIQSCERLNTAEKIANLQYHMVLDFTERVEQLHLTSHPGKLAIAVANYVQHHLSDTISTESLAQSLFMGRSYLSTKFHHETGMKLNDFIQSQKIEEAKRLLRYTDRSAAAIGEYLAFSSPAYFTRVFKKTAGMTPNEYREKHRA